MQFPQFAQAHSAPLRFWSDAAANDTRCRLASVFLLNETKLGLLRGAHVHQEMCELKVSAVNPGTS